MHLEHIECSLAGF